MLEVARTFYRSLDRLTAAEQAAVKPVAFDYLADPSRPGLSLHRIDRARDKRFWTIRVSRDLRIIVFKEGARSLFCYVGHHDDAYAWAERRRFEVHPVTGAAQIVEIAEVVREEIRLVQREAPRPGILAKEDPKYLLSLGVPETYLDLIREVDEDGLWNLFPRLPEEVQEALFMLAAGERPEPRPVERDLVSDPFAHPDAQRRFWIASDEAVLAEALARHWEEWLVFLHPSQRMAVERNFNGASRVSGSAGTGKSVVAMHRAAHLARLSTGGRIFLTTFSKTLASRLADGMSRLLGANSEARGRVEVLHLHAYAFAEMARQGSNNIVESKDIDRLIREKRGNLDASVSDAFLRAEWDQVVDYWGLSRWDDYRDISRTGRGVALTPRRRRELWAVFEAMIADLNARNAMTWGDLCDRVRARIAAGAGHPFQHVIVDEAQDFGPRELKLVAAMASPGPRSVFFAGDIGQRIYRWPFSWTSVGIDVRGRSHRLKVNYRTSAQIRHFADGLLPGRLAEVDGQEEVRTTVSVLNGPEPEIVCARSIAEEIGALAQWMKELLNRGYQPNQIAILGRTRRAVDARAQPAVDRAGLAAHWLPPTSNPADATVTLGTLHAAKGLEFRAVALVGCDAHHVPLRSEVERASSPEEHQIAEAREICLLYVGCTRARESLLITYHGQPSPYISRRGELSVHS
jgi:superfamily I DNA/RNA helicase